MITTEVIIGARRFIRDSSPQSCLATSSLTLHLNIISRSRSSSSTTISPAHHRPARSRYPSAKTSVVCVWYCEQWFSVTLSAFYLILHFGHENPLSFVCTGKIFVHFANCSMNVLSDMPPLGQNPFFNTYLVIMTIPLLHMIQSIIAFVPSVIRLAHTDRDVKAKRA